MFKLMRVVRKQQKEFAELWGSPDAYRPGDRHDRRHGPDEVLHRLADWANECGLTAGDAGQLAIAFIRRIDRFHSYDEALIRLLQAVDEGRLRTVVDQPLKRFASPEAIVDFCEGTAAVARPEAFSEALQQAAEAGWTDGTPRGQMAQVMAESAMQEEVGALVEEYRMLKTEPAPLLGEVKRMQEIREKLVALGIDPETA